MALRMARPTKHPKSGTYAVRVAISRNLQTIAKQLFGVSVELRENLGTKDPDVAKRLGVAATARLQSKHDHARQVQADGHGNRYVTPTARNRQNATALLQDHGFAADPSDSDHLASQLVLAEYRRATMMVARAREDWSPDPYVALYPEMPAQPSSDVAPPRSCLVDDIVRGWARGHGCDVDAKPIARAAYDKRQTAERLARFFGHRDAAQVTKADLVRWKEAALSRGVVGKNDRVLSP
jgi:hypothetical protein